MNERRDKILLRIPVIIFILITVGFWSFYDRYERLDSLLTRSPDLSAAIVRRGDVTLENGQFILTVTQPKPKTVRVDFPIKLSISTAALVRVSMDMKIDHVVPGRYPWERARLLLGQYDQKGKWVSGEHQVVGIEGSLPWKRYQKVFEVREKTATARLILQQIGSSGTVWFKNIRIESVRIKSSFLWWRVIFATLWVAMGMFYFPRCRLNKRKLRLLITLNAIAILIGALVPGAWMKDLSDRLQKVRVEWVVKKKPLAKQKGVVEKKPKIIKSLEQTDRFEELVKDTHRTGHFGLFASLCFLVYLSAALERQRFSYLIKVGLDVLLFAVVTETLQLLTVDRSAGVGDLKIDLQGMILAFVIFMLFVWPVLWLKDRRVKKVNRVI